MGEPKYAWKPLQGTELGAWKRRWAKKYPGVPFPHEGVDVIHITRSDGAKVTGLRVNRHLIVPGTPWTIEHIMKTMHSSIRVRNKGEPAKQTEVFRATKPGTRTRVTSISGGGLPKKTHKVLMLEETMLPTETIEVHSQGIVLGGKNKPGREPVLQRKVRRVPRK